MEGPSSGEEPYFWPRPFASMNDGRHNPPGREEEQKQCVERYEAMAREHLQQYFDVEEWALIVGHYLDKSDTRRAREVVDLAMRQHPGSTDLRFWEAHVLMDSGKLNKALEVLDGLEKVEPYNGDIQLHKGSIYSQLRNYRKAIDHFKRALDMTEEDHDNILLDLAFEYENLEEFDEAIGCLKKAVAINPENEAVLFELAYAYDLAAAQDASVVYFRQFTNQFPYSFVGWYNLGNALSALERFDESNEALDLSIAIDEKFTSAYFSKARNLLVQGHYERAIEVYRETQAFDGPQAVTFSFIGECFEKMERYQEALIHYDQAIALDPAWVDAWIGRGVTKDMQGRSPEALADLEQAVRLQPESTDAWYYYANTLGRAGRYEEALSAYARLNTMEPEGLDGWMDHADLLLHVKGPEAALKKLKEGELVHQLNPRYRYRMVSYLLRCGREQQALLELEEALMADHSGHAQLLEHYPEAGRMPQVMHLLDLYRK